MKYFTTIADTVYEIKVQKDGTIFVDGTPHQVQQEPFSPNASSLLIGNRSHEVVVVGNREGLYEVVISGEKHEVLVQDELTYRVAQAQEAAAANMGEVTIKSPMPGLIIDVPVAVGDKVTKGQTLIILESMKMENELKSPRDGIVLKIETETGASVEKGQNLVAVGDAD